MLVVTDPAETENKASDEPMIVSSLMQAMLAYNRTSVPSFVCSQNQNFTRNGALAPFG